MISPLATHPDLAAEQAHIDEAYDRLEAMRDAARQRMAAVLDQGRGGTPQAKTERDMVVRASLGRMAQLDLGDRPLCFGRIDLATPAGPGDGDDTEQASYHIGRLPVSGPGSELLVVDWRAPVAEPFYRATGSDPMGLSLRRHFASEGRKLVGIEDEVFNAGAESDHPADSDEPAEDVPSGALLAAMSASRSGYLRDIVATVQREQDEIIRAPMSGLLVVQGGPGTGKTVVALHRAAYLLYTHRFPLESQGVLVIGPNRLYLRYTEQVLPSLGENGVASSTVEGLLDVPVRGVEAPGLARIKGQARMAKVLAAALSARQRTLGHDLAVPYGSVMLQLKAQELAQVIRSARRRPGTHNARRSFVESAVTRRLAAAYEQASAVVDELRPRPAFDLTDSDRDPDAAASRDVPGELRRLPQVVEALDRMWPRLLPEELLHDLYGSEPLLRLAGKGLLDASEQMALFRPRSGALDEIAWTRADIPLLDEAAVALGPPRRDNRDNRDNGAGSPRAYGHIVVDEAQDLSPMQLRMLARRSISGSMTLVGDIAQATGPHAVTRWSQVTEPLRPRHPPRMVTLSVNYRTPAEIMNLAARVLSATAPDLRPPRSVRQTGAAPIFVEAGAGRLLAELVACARDDLHALGRGGTLAVICAGSMLTTAILALREAGLAVSNPSQSWPGTETLGAIAVELVKGLEFDRVIALEPAQIVEEAGPNALYVALTRPTRRLSIVHELALPDPIRPPGS